MLKTTFTVFTAALLLTVSAWSADPASTQDNSPAAQFRSELRNVQTYATEVANMAKSKRSNASEVKTKAELLAESVRRLRSIAQQGDQIGVTGEDQRKTISTATEVMEIIVNNKMQLLNSEQYERNRGLVRGKANGIVERVKIIERNLGSARS